MSADGLLIERGAASHADVKVRATFRDYLALTKMGITVANLMATFAGVWVASHGRPSLWNLLWTLLGTALVVASGAALNNYVDRDIDDKMDRTSNRVSVSGKVAPENIFRFGLTLGVLGIVILAALVNLTAAGCAFVGLVFYAYIYTVWLKRTTTLSTVLGGVAGAMPPLIGWAGGSGGSLNVAAWSVFFVFFLWQPPHFLPLAMKRVEEYRKAGVPMLPVVRGFKETKQQILRYTAAMLPVSMLPYFLHFEGAFYFVVMTALGLVFLTQAFKGLFASDDLQWANKLFKLSLIYLTSLCLVLVVGVV